MDVLGLASARPAGSRCVLVPLSCCHQSVRSSTRRAAASRLRSRLPSPAPRQRPAASFSCLTVASPAPSVKRCSGLPSSRFTSCRSLSSALTDFIPCGLSSIVFPPPTHKNLSGKRSVPGARQGIKSRGMKRIIFRRRPERNHPPQPVPDPKAGQNCSSRTRSWTCPQHSIAGKESKSGRRRGDDKGSRIRDGGRGHVCGFGNGALPAPATQSRGFSSPWSPAPGPWSLLRAAARRSSTAPRRGGPPSSRSRPQSAPSPSAARGRGPGIRLRVAGRKASTPASRSAP